jgi:hypothetical protein
MAVAIEQIKPGAVFRFKKALRRVKSLSPWVGNGCSVNWEYADGQKRGGKLIGTQWVHYFRADAIDQVPDASLAGEPRLIKPSGKSVPSLNYEVVISIHTKCPAKWAMVDMETGDLWGHDGSSFSRLTIEQAGDVAAVAHQVSLQS